MFLHLCVQKENALVFIIQIVSVFLPLVRFMFPIHTVCSLVKKKDASGCILINYNQTR